MLYLGACLMIGATIEILMSQRPSSIAIGGLCVGAVVASGASVLGIAWAATFVLFILIYSLAISQKSLRDLVSDHYIALAVTSFCIIALIVHDARMFALGRRPTLLHESNISTVLFSFYGNLGLLGVGPGMVESRANGVSALTPSVPIIVAATVLFSLLAVAGLIEIRSMLGNPTSVLVVGCIVLPVAFTFALGFFLHCVRLAASSHPARVSVQPSLCIRDCMVAAARISGQRSCSGCGHRHGVFGAERALCSPAREGRL